MILFYQIGFIVFLFLLISLLNQIFSWKYRKKKTKMVSNSVDSLSKLPTITITANSIILDENYYIIPESAKVLHGLSNEFNVFLFVQINDEDQFEQVSNLVFLELNGIIPNDNILFCQTNIGRSPMARQLNSKLHIESDIEAAKLNSLFIPTALISKSCMNDLNVRFQSNSLVNLFHDYHLAISNTIYDL